MKFVDGEEGGEARDEVHATVADSVVNKEEPSLIEIQCSEVCHEFSCHVPSASWKYFQKIEKHIWG